MTTTDVAHDLAVKFPSAGRSPEFVRLYAELFEALPPGMLPGVEQLVRLAEQAAEQSGYSEAWTLVDNIAQHFPGFGPAIRAVAHHLLEDVRRGDCGVRRDERQPSEWVACVGSVPIDPAA